MQGLENANKCLEEVVGITKRRIVAWLIIAELAGEDRFVERGTLKLEFGGILGCIEENQCLDW